MVKKYLCKVCGLDDTQTDFYPGRYGICKKHFAESVNSKKVSIPTNPNSPVSKNVKSKVCKEEYEKIDEQNQEIESQIDELERQDAKIYDLEEANKKFEMKFNIIFDTLNNYKRQMTENVEGMMDDTNKLEVKVQELIKDYIVYDNENKQLKKDLDFYIKKSIEFETKFIKLEGIVDSNMNFLNILTTRIQNLENLENQDTQSVISTKSKKSITINSSRGKNMPDIPPPKPVPEWAFNLGLTNEDIIIFKKKLKGRLTITEIKDIAKKVGIKFSIGGIKKSNEEIRSETLKKLDQV
jgi:hypothetical protein